MAKRLIINMGFITNSSSAIHWFPKELLDEPEIKTFMEAYGLSEGYVGENLWSRSGCESILITPEQKQRAAAELNNTDYSPGTGDQIGNSDKDFVLVYGDEYQSVTSELANLLETVCARKSLQRRSTEYN